MLLAPLAPVTAKPVAVIVPPPVRLIVNVALSGLLLAMVRVPIRSPFTDGVKVMTKVVMLPAAMERLVGGVFSAKSLLVQWYSSFRKGARALSA
jgi:hypothetical protein